MQHRNVEYEPPYFTSSERDFLSVYVPTKFSNKPLKDMLDNIHTSMEINQTVFDIIVKLDITVQRGGVKSILREKPKILNPIFEAFGLETISSSEDPYVSIFKLKKNGLEVLKRLTPNPTTFYKKSTEKGHKFQNEKVELRRLFGNIPSMIYGSSLKSPNPSNIDTMIFPNKISPHFYRKIDGVADPNRKIPLFFSVTPIDYLPSFVFSETRKNFNERNSIMLNGGIDVPIVEEPYLDELRLHHMALEYYNLRRTLTIYGLEICQRVIPRINAYLKKPKIIYEDLELNKIKLGAKPEVKKLDKSNLKFELVDALVDANMTAYYLLQGYLENK